MYNFLSKLFFLIGLLLGVFTACLIIVLNSQFDSPHKITKLSAFPNNTKYSRWLRDNGLRVTPVSIDKIRYEHVDFLLASQYLYVTVNVLCLILTRNHKNAEAAKATWAQSCNEVRLVDLQTNKRRMIVSIKKDKQNSSWKLLCKEILSVCDKFDWILIVNDNTFGIVENLRLFVAPLNKTKPYYLGHAVNFWGVTYNTGLAGYALNKVAVESLKKKLRINNGTCLTETSFLNKEDFYLGKLLASLHITPEDTRDPFGLSTFHSYNLLQEFFIDLNYYKTSFYPVVCCSSQSITFQAIEADKIYMYYYLIYTLQVFREGNLGNAPAPTPMPEDEMWKSFLRKRGIDTNVSSKQYYKIWEDLVQDPKEFAKVMRPHINN